MTGRAGLALVAQTADRLGLTDALSQAVGGCRSWRDHDPGKVVCDIVLTLADGGDALRHMAVLDQAELFAPGRLGFYGQPHGRREAPRTS